MRMVNKMGKRTMPSLTYACKWKSPCRIHKLISVAFAAKVKKTTPAKNLRSITAASSVVTMVSILQFHRPYGNSQGFADLDIAAHKQCIRNSESFQSEDGKTLASFLR